MTTEREDRRRDFLLLLAATGDIESAAKNAGISPRTLARERSGDAEFNVLIGDAITLAGEPQADDVASWSERRLMFSLCVLKPQKFGAAYHEVHGIV